MCGRYMRGIAPHNYINFTFYFLLFTCHKVLQYDACWDFIDEGFVASLHHGESSVEHRLVGDCGSEAFVVEVQGHFGEALAEFSCEGPYACSIFRGLSVELLRHTDNDTLHLLPLEVVGEERHKLLRVHRRKPVCDDLHRVGDGDTCAALSVVDGKYSQCSLMVIGYRLWVIDPLTLYRIYW